MNARNRTALGLGLALALSAGCREKPAPLPEAEAPPSSPAPDRLAEGERLPEAETAFGLPLPAGMHLVRQYDGSAYFQGVTNLEETLAYLRQHLAPATVQLTEHGAEFPRVRILGGNSEHLYRVDVTRGRNGSQVLIEDITPPPALIGLSEEEMWRRAGRNPDGTQIDPNSVY